MNDDQDKGNILSIRSDGMIALSHLVKAGDRSVGIDIAGDRAQIQDDTSNVVADSLGNGEGKRNPWDRNGHESHRAWEAFKYFRDIGAATRGYQMVAQDLGHEIKTVRNWVDKYNWQHRVAAWDIHLDQIAQRAFEAEAMSMGRRHAHIGMKLQTLGAERIGEYVEREDLKGTITIREALEITKTGVAIEREARAADKSSAQSGSGNIIFNFNMGGKAPKWAPKVIEAREAVMNELGNIEEAADGEI